MNLQPLYDVKERLEYAAIAGTGLLGEDFRLKRAAEALKPLAAASPVLGKIDAGLTALLSAPAEERSGRLPDVLALVDAVAYTQAKTGRQGELEPLPVGGGTCCQISYGQLSPLLTALTTTGGGRAEIVKSVRENHPEFFSDYRVLPAVVAGLGDSYGEMAELNAEILKQTGPAVLPLLKKGFDPAGKREMVRRVEVIAALEGEKATPWLKEMLPEAKKDVRAAVITALGVAEENTALLLDLAKSERGSNRDAVLTVLSRMDGEAVRDLWKNELAKNPDHVSFLPNSSTEWAAELVAEGMRSRLEYAMYERRIVTREMKTELQQWCAALRGGKASPAMLDFWRWVDGHFDDIRRLESVGNSGFQLTSHMTTRLMESLCAAGPGPLSELCLELWGKDKDSPRWLSHAVAAALMTCPATEVYDEFAPYVPTAMPLVGREQKEQLNSAVVNGLTRVYRSQSLGRYLFREGSYAPAQALDPRWIGRLARAAWKPNMGSCYPFSGGDAVSGFDKNLAELVDPNDPEQCGEIVPYLRGRMAETGSWYSYSRYLLQFGGSFKDVLGEAMKKTWGKNVQLYHVWQILSEASKTLPAGDIAELCREVLDHAHFRSTGTELFLAKKALPWTMEQLREGKPFPEWDEWWEMRP